MRNIPQKLAVLDRWVVWKYELRDGKQTKVPYDPRTHRRAKTTNPATWGTLEQALSALATEKYAGIGIVFVGGGGLVGIDLDHCRDPETGEIEPWAQEFIRIVNSYTEISPSRRGVHTIVQGELPPGGRRKGQIEMYDSARYFTVTGDHVPGTPMQVQERTTELEMLHEQVFGSAAYSPTVTRSAGAGSLDDSAILKKALSARNGDKFGRLFSGDATGYQSQSEADMALCQQLAFWTDADAARIDSLFRQSGLIRPKWDSPRSADGRTYGEITIAAAIAHCGETYTGRPREGSSRPQIVVSDRRLQDVRAETESAMVQANDPPALFARSGSLCRIRTDDNGLPQIEALNEAQVRHHAALAANFVQQTRRGIKHVSPPLDVVRDLIAKGEWGFPPLHGVVQTPVLRRDGTVLDRVGYDPATRLIYVPAPALVIPAISASPTAAELRFAREVVEEAIGDFPFADDASRANLWALLLTPAVRPSIGGCVPMALINSPKQGTGKSLLTRLLGVITLGTEVPLLTAPRDEDEWRKRITAVLATGASIVAIDNVEGALDSPNLAAALTSPQWSDRILGRTESITIPQRATWVATGNNLTVGGDLARRCYSIRLDARCERPWMDRKFKHPNLIEWATENRGQLLSSLLTVARAWHSGGRPAGDAPVLGSFEEWSRTVGGILTHGGIEGFLGNLEDMYAQSDEDGPQWERFFSAWYCTQGSNPITTAEVVRKINLTTELRDALPDTLVEHVNDQGKLRVKLGQALARRRDAQYGCYRLERDKDSHTKAALWRLTAVIPDLLAGMLQFAGRDPRSLTC